jgi:hypothetical protein
MTAERIQLHSALGRLMYFMVASFFWMAIGASLMVWRLSGDEQNLEPLRVVLPFECVPLFFVWRWARRSGGTIYATRSGLELARSKLVIPWSVVAHAERIPLLSRLQPYYRICFSDDRRPLAFYGCEDVEKVVGHFKAAAEPAS